MLRGNGLWEGAGTWGANEDCNLGEVACVVEGGMGLQDNRAEYGDILTALLDDWECMGCSRMWELLPLEELRDQEYAAHPNA